ncbi:MAG: xanthine dehydrogenase family protein subunit M [Anaerolineales bacterium]|nr:xanthine dehydrogenase family protein subunit M [Anaerolineales bacterium]
MLNPTPGLSQFDYVKPGSLQEASRFLAEHAGEARPFLGGTDTFVRLRDGVWRDKYLVDVKGFAGMNMISFDPDEGLIIGAAVNMNRVIADTAVNTHYPVLAQASRTVASHQLRSRATIVGNICNASPAGDTIGACIVLGGRLQVHGVDGEREEPLAGFFLGPGKSVLNPGDVVTAVKFPTPPAKYAARYIKLGRNAVGDLAIVGVTALCYKNGSTPSGYRVLLALTSVAPIPFVPVAAEAVLAQNLINSETIAWAAEAAMNSCDPISDTRGSARYRKLMVRNLVKQAVTAVWEEVQNRG